MVLLLLVLVGEAGSGLIDTVVSERSGASYTSILVLTSYVQLCSDRAYHITFVIMW